jgi:hypothetical protein
MSDELRDAIEELSQDLQLPLRFLPSLLEEGDWSFVIKSHALLEAALAHLLSTAVLNSSLTSVFLRLETSNETSGKLAFIRAMDLLPDRQRKFIKHLSELRNRLVHDVSNCSFSFSDYIESLDQGQRRKFRDAFSWRVRPDEHTPPDDWYERVFEHPKSSIFVNLLILLSESYKTKRRFREFLEDHDLP